MGEELLETPADYPQALPWPKRQEEEMPNKARFPPARPEEQLYLDTLNGLPESEAGTIVALRVYVGENSDEEGWGVSLTEELPPARLAKLLGQEEAITSQGGVSAPPQNDTNIFLRCSCSWGAVSENGPF